MLTRVPSVSVLVLALFVLASASAAAAGATYSYTFEPHSTFFSAETHQSTLVDPQVFVADSLAAAATGPQGIAHVAGYRPARPGIDASTTPLFNAQGKALGITLGQWLGVTGSGTITCSGNTAVATNTFRGLIPGGLYQVTRLQFTSKGPLRNPLGAANGSDSTFTAAKDGTASFTNTLPFCPSSTEGVVLAYHSDAQAHGAAMGQIGVNLHNQLATRLVAAPTLPHTGGVPIVALLGLGLALVGLGHRLCGGLNQADQRRG